ncbi:MAG: aminopeptidase [Acidobacteria bacterium]|nr:aminopeptidase [Acidobacteriota bacterium]
MDLETGLARLADVCVTVGVNVQPGQELIISAPLEASALVREVGRRAYQRGATLVTCLYDDPQLIVDHFVHGDDASLDAAADWMYRGTAEALTNGAARLYVVGPYPDLLNGIPPDKIVRLHKAMAQASGAESALTATSRVNWSTVPFATHSWARQVFPALGDEEALRSLWEAIFDVTLVSAADPSEAWSSHNRALNARRESLQARRFDALRFYDGTTDLTIGLVEGHRWLGGTVVAANGIEGMCNMPTEEVFTCPHRARTEGHVLFSRPLALAGTLVTSLRVEFREGRVVSAAADSGIETFEALIRSDEGASQLGEIGLVPNSSRIAQTGILFYNALFDENAATHLAFGQSYAACLTPADESGADAGHGGANQSSIHIDAMFGHAAMHVDGVSRDGHATPLMRHGDFVIDG